MSAIQGTQILSAWPADERNYRKVGVIVKTSVCCGRKLPQNRQQIIVLNKTASCFERFKFWMKEVFGYINTNKKFIARFKASPIAPPPGDNPPPPPPAPGGSNPNPANLPPIKPAPASAYDNNQRNSNSPRQAEQPREDKLERELAKLDALIKGQADLERPNRPLPEQKRDHAFQALYGSAQRGAAGASQLPASDPHAPAPWQAPMNPYRPLYSAPEVNIENSFQSALAEYKRRNPVAHQAPQVSKPAAADLPKKNAAPAPSADLKEKERVDSPKPAATGPIIVNSKFLDGEDIKAVHPTSYVILSDGCAYKLYKESKDHKRLTEIFDEKDASKWKSPHNDKKTLTAQDKKLYSTNFDKPQGLNNFEFFDCDAVNETHPSAYVILAENSGSYAYKLSEQSDDYKCIVKRNWQSPYTNRVLDPSEQKKYSDAAKAYNGKPFPLAHAPVIPSLQVVKQPEPIIAKPEPKPAVAPAFIDQQDDLEAEVVPTLIALAQSLCMESHLDHHESNEMVTNLNDIFYPQNPIFLRELPDEVKAKYPNTKSLGALIVAVQHVENTTLLGAAIWQTLMEHFPRHVYDASAGYYTTNAVKVHFRQ